MNRRLTLIAALCLACTMSLSAVTYYVSPNGNDSNNGSSGSPWRTITKAESTASSPGDTVYIAGGTYSGGVIFNASGNAANRIRFIATGNATMSGVANVSGRYLTFSGISVAPPSGGSWGAINLQGSYNIMTNCAIPSYGATAAQQKPALGFGGDHNLFVNSVIKDLTDIDAIHFFGHHNTVRGCIISNIRQVDYAANHTDLFQCWGVNGSEVAYSNTIENTLLIDNLCQTGNVTDSNNPDVHDLTLRNNLFVRCSSTMFIGMPNVRIHNNVFFQCAKGPSAPILHPISLYTDGTHRHASGAEIINNVFLDCGVTDSDGKIFFSGSTPNRTVRNNYYATDSYGPTSGSLDGTDNINGGDPKFVNENGNDFHVNAGSVLVDAGANLASFFTTDREDNARPTSGSWSIGAYAYGSVGVPRPVVNAGRDSSISLPTNSVALIGSASHPTGAPLSVTWSVLSGPGSVTFSAPSSVATLVTVPTVGAYALRLTASDGTNSASDDVTVTLNPEPKTSVASFEAESGVITAPFAVAGGAVGQGVQTGLSDGGRAVYSFSVPEYGAYTIAAYVDAPSDGANSLFVRVDGEPLDPFHVWDIPVTSGYESRVVAGRGNGDSEVAEFDPKLFILEAGQHSLVVIGREIDVSFIRFDVFLEGSEAPTPPSGLRIVAEL